MSILIYFLLGCVFSLLVASSYLDKLSKKDNVIDALIHSVKVRYNEIKTNTAGKIDAESVDILVVPTEQYNSYEKVQEYLPGLTDNDKTNLYKLCTLVPLFPDTFLAGKEQIESAYKEIKRKGLSKGDYGDKVYKYILWLSENPFAQAFVEGFFLASLNADDFSVEDDKPKKKGKKNGKASNKRNTKKKVNEEDTTDSK